MESVPSKDVQKAEIETDKSNTAVETKIPITATTQIIAVKPTEKDDANVKNSLEVKSKNEIAENVPPKIQEKQPIAVAAVEKQSTKEHIDSKPAENIKDTAPKEKEEPIKSIKSTEKAENTTTAKSTAAPPPPPAAEPNKTNAKECITDSLEILPEETTTAAATPVKKVGRLAKAAKSKTAITATPVESKIPESQEDKPAATSARVKRKLKSENSVASDSAPSTPKDDDLDRKSKRHRLKTILYQSPLPELAYITKLSASEASNSPKPMSNEDRSFNCVL